MSDISDNHDIAVVTPRRPRPVRRETANYVLEEAYWGYRIVPTGTPPLRLVASQTVSLLAGAGCLAAGIALAVLADASELVMRLPVVFLACAIGVVLMWFASRGTHVQFEIDTMNGEVREAVRNRTGATTVVARYGFDCIGSIFMIRPDSGLPTLTLRYRNTARQLAVATGPEADLTRLRDRLGRDLILSREAI